MNRSQPTAGLLVLFLLCILALLIWPKPRTVSEDSLVLPSVWLCLHVRDEAGALATYWVQIY